MDFILVEKWDLLKELGNDFLQIIGINHMPIKIENDIIISDDEEFYTFVDKNANTYSICVNNLQEGLEEFKNLISSRFPFFGIIPDIHYNYDFTQIVYPEEMTYYNLYNLMGGFFKRIFAHPISGVLTKPVLNYLKIHP